MRDSIKLTDEEIENLVNDAFGGIGVCCDDLVFSRDTIDDFKAARKSYNEPGFLDEGNGKSISILKAQVTKGTPRKDIYVYDFGEFTGTMVY